MPFIERFDFNNGRMYTHGNKESFLEKEPVNYFLSALNRLEEKEKYCFFIGLLWQNEGKNVIDLGCYPSEARRAWQQNYETYDFAYSDGIWAVVPGWTCGDGKILFGREEENRRCTKSLEEFAKKPLALGFINQLLKFKS